ncbi:MAG: biotin/lipoyl-binding protein, partial [Endomicrobia bacterium]|nr:biotin/lipoyl-binding protein [Endomicrobiia bacterium]
IFRDVVSPKTGVVKKILVEDGKYVEYGQPLIVLELKE